MFENCTFFNTKLLRVHDHDNIARTRQDYSHYRVMLRDLRRVEEGHGDNSKIVYLIQVNLIFGLVLFYIYLSSCLEIAKRLWHGLLLNLSSV